jgi:aspartate 1-decarboxylase
MLLQLLRAKIQQLIVTESSEGYPGSIALPDELIEASGLKLFEQVYVNNLTNRNRIMTYVVRSKKEGYVSLNGLLLKNLIKATKYMFSHLLIWIAKKKQEIFSRQSFMLMQIIS